MHKNTAPGGCVPSTDMYGTHKKPWRGQKNFQNKKTHKGAKSYEKR